ncbi:MAG: DUF3168 domain-containing protein [Brevundimonas sp.]|uniref:tail completion protein gp17 n=1 Tax=Brevundimonas sp. TaxID=1871086 RepID=UPI00391D5D27
MEEALLAHLAANGGVRALVSDRIEWTARGASPSIALHLITSIPDTTLAGQSGLVEARVQIDCWADTFLKAKQIGNAVIAALPARHSVIGEVRFLACTVLGTDRDRSGETPNQLHRTRIDVRVATNTA